VARTIFEVYSKFNLDQHEPDLNVGLWTMNMDASLLSSVSSDY
jgi:hypothetical protein